MPAGPNQNDARCADSARFADLGQRFDSFEQRREAGLAERLVVGAQVVVVARAVGQHGLDEIGQKHLALMLQFVLLVVRVGAALGLHLHLQMSEARAQILRRPSLHRGPVLGHVGQHQRAAAAHVAFEEMRA